METQNVTSTDDLCPAYKELSFITTVKSCSTRTDIVNSNI